MSTQLPAHVRKVASIMKRPPANISEEVIQKTVAILSTAMEPEKAAEAATRVGLAFNAARVATKDPSAFDKCTTDSVAQCVADCVITGLMPGGPNADAWLIPRGGKLTFMVSHRGLQKLSNKAGFHMVPVAVGPRDEIEVSCGEVTYHKQDLRSTPSGLNELVGVILRVKDLGTGGVLGDFWVPQQAILGAKNAKDHRGKLLAGPIWDVWPIRMAMKTAMRYGMARGLVPCQSETIARALVAEERDHSPQRTVINARPVAVQAPPSAVFQLDGPSEPPEQPQPEITDTAEPSPADAPPWSDE